MELVNLRDCHLMVWETNQAKINLNNEIKFSVSTKTKVSVGDEILCPIGSGKNSTYKIVEILETRASTMSNVNYITAKTEWYIN